MPNTIRAECPQCRASYTLPGDAEGKAAACRTCGATFTVAAVSGVILLPEPDAPRPPRTPSQLAPVTQSTHNYYVAEKSPGIAAILEVVPGLMCQTFGLGHMYAGSIGFGLFVMFGYWLILAANLTIGSVTCVSWFTLPLCWVGTAVVSSLLASSAAGPQAPDATTTQVADTPERKISLARDMVLGGGSAVAIVLILLAANYFMNRK